MATCAPPTQTDASSPGWPWPSRSGAPRPSGISYAHGWLLYYGDAEAHLNIARRIVDSQTPGYDQIGTVWLPLPHALMLPFVREDALWRSGLAGSIPSAPCFIAAGCFLFAAARRIFESTEAGVAAAALLALNPNLLYLQSTAMTEAAFAASITALLYFSVRFRQTQGWGSVVRRRRRGLRRDPGAVRRLVSAALRRGLFLLYGHGAEPQWRCVFCALAGAGPLYWLGQQLVAHRRRAGVLPRAVFGARHPGRPQTIRATTTGASRWLYYGDGRPAVREPCWRLLAIGGAVAAIARRIFWPLALLALPGIFYVWSLHSSATPIYVPELWPHTYYNSRYGLAALPLLALAAAALVAAVPAPRRNLAAALVVAAGAGWWAAHPRPENWITWAEARVNSEDRRAGASEAAAYLAPRYKPGTGIITSFGDLTAIWRTAGIPLRETFTGDNGLPYDAALAKPELHLGQEWAVTTGGSPLEIALRRAARFGVRYNLELTIERKNEPAIRIYRR